MKVNVTQQLKDFGGLPIPTPPTCPTCGRPQGEPFTLRTVCVNALSSDFRNEQQVTPEEKHKRWALAVKIYNSEEAELSASDVVLIQKVVAYMYPPLVAGQVWEMLEKME